MKRRQFCQTLALAPTLFANSANAEFALNYILSSAMYGKAPLAEILPEAAKVGATHIDLWPAPHANQHEQILKMGAESAAALFAKHDVKLGGIACYKFGPFEMPKQMRLARKMGFSKVVFVSGGRGNRKAKGEALKKEVATFAEKMKPVIAAAEEMDQIIAIENHGNNIIDSPDSMRWLLEFTQSPRLGIAFAPHHLCPRYLPLDGVALGKLARELGPDGIAFVYAQQYGKGSHHKQPRTDELLQMPGRGPLDFGPLVRTLRDIDYRGFTEIFMHPYPRGLPILDSTAAITAEINRSRSYLDAFLKDPSQ